jgi:hypothetical protein
MVQGLTNTIQENGVALTFHQIVNATSDLASNTTHVWLASYVDQSTAQANPQSYVCQHDWIFSGYGLTSDQLYQLIISLSVPVTQPDGSTVESNIFYGAATC